MGAWSWCKEVISNIRSYTPVVAMVFKGTGRGVGSKLIQPKGICDFNRHIGIAQGHEGFEADSAERHL